MITYRLLQPEEWSRLDEIRPLLGHDRPLPSSPQIADCVIAEEDGLIAGLLFMQMAPHLEPLVISPKHTGRVNYLRMVDVLERLYKERLSSQPSNGHPPELIYYVFSPNPRIGKMAKVAGMTFLPYRVWHKKLTSNGVGTGNEEVE